MSNRIPPNAPIMQLVDPGADRAVSVAMHKLNPDRFHRERLVPDAPCPFCPDEEPQTELQEEILRKMEELSDVESYAPWQRKLASEVLAAQMAPDNVPVSDALQTYLDERSLVADPGEIEDEEIDE